MRKRYKLRNNKNKKDVLKVIATISAITIAAIQGVMLFRQDLYQKQNLEITNKLNQPKFELITLDSNQKYNTKIKLSHGYAYNIQATIFSYFTRTFGNSEEIFFIQEGLCTELGIKQDNSIYLNIRNEIPVLNQELIDMLEKKINLENPNINIPNIKHLILIQYEDLEGNKQKIFLRRNFAVDQSLVTNYRELNEESYNFFSNKAFHPHVYKIRSFKDFDDIKYLNFIKPQKISKQEFLNQLFDY